MSVTEAALSLPERNALVVNTLGLVRWLMRKLRATVFVAPDWEEDIYQAGVAGLIRAADKYRPDQGTPFVGFTVKYIWGHMLDALCVANEVPAEVYRQYSRIRAAREKLQAHLGREPTVPELAAECHHRESTIRHTLHWVEGRIPCPWDEPAGPTKDADLQDVIPSDDDIETAVEANDEVRYMLRDCTAEQRFIAIEHVVKERPLHNVARELGITVGQAEAALEAAFEQVRREQNGGNRGASALGIGFPVARFWSNVERTEDCWYWRGTKTKQGYGQFSERRGRGWKHHLAHRASWMLVNGKIPKGCTVVHTCGDRACVRVDHLQLVPRGKTH